MPAVNAFVTHGLELARKTAETVYFCGDGTADGKTELFTPFGCGKAHGNIYVPTLAQDDTAEEVSDYLIENDAKAVVRACFDMEEAGVIEAKYKLSPIMLLHRLGILNRCIIAGGVCLYNDDLDLMAQEDVPLVITPTASAGYGYGYAPVCAAIKRGIRVGIGTFDGKYNSSHDLEAEIHFLKLTANAEMRQEKALSENDLKKILAFSK